MAKAILMAVDDDPDVSRAIERDLRREYGNSYRVVRTDSARQALRLLPQLKLRGELVALFLVDHQMPYMTGLEFLEQTIKFFPEAKRALLTAYADTDAAICAINKAKIHYYLLKPWSPPEEKLFPILDDLLEVWSKSVSLPFEGLRIISHRWSAQCYQIKDFLARNLVPHYVLDIELHEDAHSLISYLELDQSSPLPLPIVVFLDGSHLVQPSISQLAEKVGLNTRAQMPFYDLIIVGLKD
jgi:thioredoxin reductase (NADPH)